MYEHEKLDEAQHFLSGMADDRDTPVRFRYALSAFLSAARSVLQYARREAASKAGGKEWYDEAIAARPLVKFMKDQRDTNVHQEPVSLSNDVAVAISRQVIVSGSVAVILRKADGTSTIVHGAKSAPPSSPGAQVPPATTRYSYRFPDWDPPTDAIALSQQYLAQLRSIVEAGIAERYLSG